MTTPPEGFKTESGHKAVRRTTWIGVAIVGLVQLIVPTILIGKVLFDLFTAGLSGGLPQIESAAVHKHAVYFTTLDLSDGFDLDGESKRGLVRTPLFGDDEAAPLSFEAQSGAIRMASVSGELWLTQREKTWRLSDGVVEPMPALTSEADDMWIRGSVPLSILGELHALSYDGEDVVTAWRWTDDRWQQQWSLEPTPSSIESIDAFAVDTTVHVFVSDYAEPIMYQSVTLGTPEGPWAQIAESADEWAATVVDDQPLLLRIVNDEDFNTKLVAHRGPDGWDAVSSRELRWGMSVGASTLDGNGVVVIDGLGDAVEVLTLHDDELETLHELNGEVYTSMIVGLVASQVAPMLFTLGLVFLLGARVRAHRVLDYTHNEQTRRFASLSQRALAKLVDGVIALVGPAVAFALDVDPLSADSSWLWAGWGVIVALLFGYLEGTRGWSPGKKLLGLRVVSLSLRPIGFRAAMMRQVLSTVDAMFGWLVGVAVLTLDARFQRIADQAAHSIVVENDPAQS